MTPRVLIVGAGIAGLALARALRLRGIAADVVERTAEWEASGAGMYLRGNCARALDQLAIWSEVAARANPVVWQRFLDHRGRSLADIDVRSYWEASADVWQSPQERFARRFAPAARRRRSSSAFR